MLGFLNILKFGNIVFYGNFGREKIEITILVAVEADKPDDEDLDLAARCVDLLDKTNPEGKWKNIYFLVGLFSCEHSQIAYDR